MAVLRHLAVTFPHSEVVVMPSFQPPPTTAHQLSKIPRASYQHRRTMLEKALQQEGIAAAVSTVEGDLVGRGYTWHVVAALRKEHVMWVLGSDLIASLPYWHRIRELLARITLCVVPRHPKEHTQMIEEQIQNVLRQLGLWQDSERKPKHTADVHELIHSSQLRLLMLPSFKPLPFSSSQVRLLLQEPQHHGPGLEEMLSTQVLSYIKHHYLYPPPLPLPSSSTTLFIDEVCLRARRSKALAVEVICKDPPSRSALGRKVIWDYQVICQCRSHRHSHALARELIRWAHSSSQWQVSGVEGLQQGSWIALDLSSIIIHIFDSTVYPDASSFYHDLPAIRRWSWGPRGWQRITAEDPPGL